MSDLDAECPECKRKIGVTFEQVASQATVKCSAGHRVKLVDKTGAARQVKKAMDDMEKAISKLGNLGKH
jgi:hypothetical protein